MKKIIADFNSKSGFWRVFTFLLVLCALFEFCIIQYFNFFEAKIHCGIDASFEYLKTEIISREGGFFPSHVLYGTTCPLVEKIFLITAPINRLIGNVWISYAISNLLLTIILLVVLWAIMDNMDFGITNKLLILNLFLCPYLANGYDIYNDLSYFSCMHFVPGYYSMRVLLFMLIFLVLTFDKLDKKKIVLAGITTLYCVYIVICCGLSILLFTGVPIFAFLIFKMLIKNDYKELVNWKSIFTYCIFVAIIVGRLLGGLMHLNYGDDSRYWITASEFFDNLHSVFLGFMMLVGAMPGTGATRSPMSVTGIGYAWGLIIFNVILVAFIYNLVILIREIKEKKVNEIRLLCVSTIVVLFVEFSLVNVHMGEDIFEKRYLITGLLSGFILVGMFIKELKDELIVKTLGILLLALAIVGMDLSSDYMMAISDNNSWHVDELKAQIDSTDAGLVYFWGADDALIKPFSVVRLLDLDRVYKCISWEDSLVDFGTYRYYENTTEYEGPTLLIVDGDNLGAPKSIVDKYSLLGEIDNLDIYYVNNNPIDINKWVKNPH